MNKAKDSYHTYDVTIGGILAVPSKKVAISKKRVRVPSRGLLNLLRRNENIIDSLWWVKRFRPLDEGLVIEEEQGEYQGITYCWDTPIIFKLRVPKDYSYVTERGKNQSISSIDATVLYNGIWFMALIDGSQFSTSEEIFFAGPTIRDIMVSIFKRSRQFQPVTVFPCVIPRSIGVELHVKGGKRKKGFPKYIDTFGNEESTNLIIKYEVETSHITGDNLRDILMDIYFDLRQSLNSFYLMVRKANRAQDERRDVLLMYDQLCTMLQNYIEMPPWSIFKRWRLSNILSRIVSGIQIQLVRNRLSQVHVLNESGKIDTMEDSKGIVRNLREYLKECVVKDFTEGAAEYEGLTATLSHAERLSSQYGRVLWVLVVVIAGLIGALVSRIVG